MGKLTASPTQCAEVREPNRARAFRETSRRFGCSTAMVLLHTVAFSPRFASDASMSDSSDMSEDTPRDASALPNEAEQDVLWMRRVAQGDMQAFEQLIETHQTRVIG